MTSAELLELLKLATDEEHKELEHHQSRVSFLTGLATAITAAIVAGATQTHDWLETAMLLVGPALLVAVGIHGKRVSHQFYDRFLDAIEFRAKLEQQLGLTQPSAAPAGFADKIYWKDEALVPARHLESRRKCADSSSHWHTKHLNTGYDRIARCIFTCIIGLGVLLFALIGILAWLRGPGHVAPPTRNYVTALFQARNPGSSVLRIVPTKLDKRTKRFDIASTSTVSASRASHEYWFFEYSPEAHRWLLTEPVRP